MDTSTRINLGQTGDFEWNQPFSGGGWMMVRSSPNITAWGINGALVSKMDTTHENRGWDIETNGGIISVDLVDAAPKVDLEPLKSAKKTKLEKQKSPKEKAAEEKAAKAKVEKERAATDQVSNNRIEKYKPVKMQPLSGKLIKVSTSVPVVGDGDWRHIFFTYDGSGKAAGVRIFVNGVAVPTIVVIDRLQQETIRTAAPMQLGMRSPEAQPARETRYQDLRLYAKALSMDEVKRLPYEDYVAEITAKPVREWNRDQLHVVR